MDIILIVLILFSLIFNIITIILIISEKRRTEKEKVNNEMVQKRIISEEMRFFRSEINERFDTVNNNMTKILNDGLKTNSEVVSSSIKAFSEQNGQIANGLDVRMNENRKAQDEKFSEIRAAMEGKLQAINESTQHKLDEMQKIVDEKLQKTLNERVSESFKLVSSQLEAVYGKMGEMQMLASGVNDLKKILSNVKTRGIYGEIQLLRLLEQILTKEQYEENIITKQNSNDRVEFAVKLPGNDDGKNVYLPIDSKFPMDMYINLQDAYETGNKEFIEQTSKDFENIIRKNAKDIHDKYIDPPNTTDFGLMFLPTEGLYAEVSKRGHLTEKLLNDYNISIVGPTTISAFLNSLQMGFRTLTLQKSSHEVWKILGAVKSEFKTFNDVLETVKKRIISAEDDLDKLIGTRTNAMMRKLKNVEELPVKDDAKIILYENNNNYDDINESVDDDIS